MRRTFGIRASLLMGAALAASPALAQTTETPPAAPADSASVVEDQGDGDIVVTARRRAESVIDVPIAMSVVTGDQLERTGAVDITALQDKTPNLTLQIARGSNSTLIAFSRGVGQQDPLWGFEPGVGRRERRGARPRSSTTPPKSTRRSARGANQCPNRRF